MVRPANVTYRKTSSRGAVSYEVLLDGVLIGRVSKFHMGAGQFGVKWLATTPAGERSTRFPSRDQAAGWLVGQG